MNYALHIITMIGIALPNVLGYNLIFGRGKILHFGPMATSLISAYGIFLTQRATGNYVLAFVVGLLVSLLLSAFFAWLALRLESDALGILTIAMHLAILAVVLNWSSLTRGALGVSGIPRMTGLSSLPAFAFTSIAVAILWVLLMHRVHRSSLGRQLSALAENRAHAEALGISRARVTLFAFLIAGTGATISNFLFPQYISLLHPNDYQFKDLIFFIMCVVAGGPGSVRGVTIAIVLLTCLQQGIRFLPLPYALIGPVRLIVFGLILIVAVFIRRKEIFPMQRTV